MNVFLDDIRETPAGYDRRTYTTLETRAIRIDASRANGFKNLGLAFEGRSRFVEAAFSYIMAIRADASDPRALHLLVNLAHSRRSLFKEIPNF